MACPPRYRKEIGNKSQVRYQNIFCSSEYIIHSCQSYLLKRSQPWQGQCGVQSAHSVQPVDNGLSSTLISYIDEHLSNYLYSSEAERTAHIHSSSLESTELEWTCQMLNCNLFKDIQARGHSCHSILRDHLSRLCPWQQFIFKTVWVWTQTYAEITHSFYFQCLTCCWHTVCPRYKYALKERIYVHNSNSAHSRSSLCHFFPFYDVSNVLLKMRTACRPVRLPL